MSEQKVSKYDRAVNRARGGEETGLVTQGSDQQLAPPQMPMGAQGMVAAFTPDTFMDEMRDAKWDCAPQIVSLVPGFVYHGILEGNGPPAELTDVMTGEPKIMDCWILRDLKSGVRISFLTTAQLDQKLPGFVGSEVKIARGNDRNIGGGKRLTEYFVAGPPTPTGFRQWHEVRQLPTGLPSGEQPKA